MPVAVAEGKRIRSRRKKSFLKGAPVTIPSPQVDMDQRRSCTKLNLVSPFSSGVARNSKAGINNVKPDVNSTSPKDPAMISMRVISLGDNGLER
jgi:hypothetical protein